MSNRRRSPSGIPANGTRHGHHPTVPQALLPLGGARAGATCRPAARCWWPTTPAACSRWTCRSSRRLLRALGYDRPLYTLSHDMLLSGRPATSSGRSATSAPTTRTPTRRCAPAASWWCSPAATTTCTGRRCRRTRSTSAAAPATCKAALNAGVPIVPTVGIGGQETQIFLSRGKWLAKRLGPIARLARAKIVPISFGFPFGLSVVIPPNIPLPTKIVMKVLPPIDIVAEFGENPDIDEVDAHVRHVMQRALDELARRAPAPCAWLRLMAITDRLTKPSASSRRWAAPDCIAPMRPDKYLRIAAAMQRENMRHHIRIRRRRAALPRPPRSRRRARHSDLARNRPARGRVGRGACRQPARPAPPRGRNLGIMARNHRGFVAALIAANRIGADVLLLNTSFAGPALAEVVQREGVDAVDLRRGVHRDRRPRAGRHPRCDADRRLDRRSPGWADGREVDRRARRPGAEASEY